MFSSAVFGDRYGICQEARSAIITKSYAWVPQIASHFLNCLQNYAQGAYSKNFFGVRGGVRSLKMPTQSLNYSYKHFSLFFLVFLISAPVAAQRFWALCTLHSLPVGLVRH